MPGLVSLIDCVVWTIIAADRRHVGVGELNICAKAEGGLAVAPLFIEPAFNRASERSPSYSLPQNQPALTLAVSVLGRQLRDAHRRSISPDAPLTPATLEG